MVLTTRSISWRTLVSRSGVPRGPRKYLVTTTLVASWLQNAGNLDVALLEDGLARLVADGGGSGLPLDLVVRVEPGVVQRRGKRRPLTPMPVKRPSGSMAATVSSMTGIPAEDSAGAVGAVGVVAVGVAGVGVAVAGDALEAARLISFSSLDSLLFSFIGPAFVSSW